MTTNELMQLLNDATVGYAKLFLRFKALENENELLKRRIEALEAGQPDSEGTIETEVN